MPGRPRRSPAAPKPALLPILVASSSLVYVAMVAFVMVWRLAYPYELEWLEGVALEHVQRLRQGLPLYTAPSLEWVPLNYTPLYFWVSAGVSLFLGQNFLALRLVSALAAVASGGLLWWLVRLETGRAAPAWLATGLFAAAFRLGGAWLDVARADSLHLALLLAGVSVARAGGSRWTLSIAAGALFALAFLAKQSAVAAAAPLCAYLAFANRPHGLATGLTLVVLVAAGVSALDARSGGWFRYYAYDVPGFHEARVDLLARFPLEDVARWFWPLLGLLGLAAWRARPSARGMRPDFHLAWAGGFLALAWLLRLYPGGYDNVLMPAHAALAALGALAFAALTRFPGRPAWPGRAAAGLVVLQLGWVAWSPAAQLPSARDRAAGDGLVEALRRLDGRVFFSSHTYLLGNAGHPGHAHVMPLMDVIRDGKGPRERALLAALRDSLAAHAWDLAVLDNRDWLSDEFTRAGYRPVATVLPAPDEFWPVTGMRTRPAYLFASPALVGDRGRAGKKLGPRRQRSRPRGIGGAGAPPG